jgi:hypothetical protein
VKLDSKLTHYRPITLELRGIAGVDGMKAFKQFVRGATKIVGGIAGFVCLRAPFTNTGLSLMAGSIVVGLACFGAYMWSEPDEDEAANSN